MKPLAKTAGALILAAALSPAMASAQTIPPPSFYGSLGYSGVGLDNVDLGAVSGRLGARFGQYFGVEGEAAFGVKDDTINPPVTIGGSPIDVELKNSFAAYAVGFLPISPKADLYVRLGYGTSEIETSIPGISVKNDERSWNYGVGGQYFLDDKNGVRADFTRYDFTKGGNEAEAWSVGYVRRF